MDHTKPYSDEYLKDILQSVKTIAMVGASPDKTKFSYGVLRVLHETGYDMIPVNPKPEIKEIRNLGAHTNPIKKEIANEFYNTFKSTFNKILNNYNISDNRY